MKNRVVAAAAALAVGVSMIPVQAGADSEKIKIMPIGDSITDGYWEQGGYRKYLSYALEQKGISGFDLVGPKGSDTESFEYNGVSVEYDGNYCGYSGYAIQNMSGAEARQGILETLQSADMIKTYDPDIVLLQIGTNDVLSAYNEGITERLEGLINYILDEGGEGETVFVTTIPDIDAITVSNWLWAYGEVKWNSSEEEFAEIVQGDVDSYNASIAELVRSMQAEGKKVMFGDIHSVVDMKADLYDGVHPNESGYEKMGLYWADVLEEYLKGSSEPATSVTTSTGTTTSATETSTTDVTTGTEPYLPEKEYELADIVGLASYLLGRQQARITPENYKKYDLNDNDELDVYDLMLMRRRLFG